MALVTVSGPLSLLLGFHHIMILGHELLHCRPVRAIPPNFNHTNTDTNSPTAVIFIASGLVGVFAFPEGILTSHLRSVSKKNMCLVIPQVSRALEIHETQTLKAVTGLLRLRGDGRQHRYRSQMASPFEDIHALWADISLSSFQYKSILQLQNISVSDYRSCSAEQSQSILSSGWYTLRSAGQFSTTSVLLCRFAIIYLRARLVSLSA